ncbi:hypothetical protein Poli38472_005863 [Pythium oligandrum]|uniref:Uncharacterized protein n=1 Tax=Pythium oligandrum TaxID=41045 RepID=A0A8K1CRU8_PYTOL|nr:hypothetical protein Poli38472_005863 [Pythium oligandrum]|eukprot:TMW68395.1 hypothetical protein Poli38472_005863 [Pythium oligandrum]
MQRVASVKGIRPEEKEDEDVRSPEHVEHVWNEAVDGAWAEGKAPLKLLTEFLQLVQDNEVEQAEATAQEILAVEPYNRLVQDLIIAMKQQRALDDQLETDDEESEEEEEEDSEGEEDDDDDEDEEEESPEQREDKEDK